MAFDAAAALGAAIGGIVGLTCGAVGGGRLIFDVQHCGLLSSNVRFLAEARHCHLVQPKQDEYVVLGLNEWGEEDGVGGYRCGVRPMNSIFLYMQCTSVCVNNS